jgi:hypothetical protein
MADGRWIWVCDVFGEGAKHDTRGACATQRRSDSRELRTTMKLNRQWKTLDRDAKQNWQQWARNTPLLLKSGHVRRVNSLRAFTSVLSNRAIAGEPANPTVPPSPVNWLQNALNLFDAGPFTAGAGFVGFRTAQALVAPTKWFFWATRLMDGNEQDVHRNLRFIRSFVLDAMPNDDVTPNFANDYRAVHGSFNGPGHDGEWDPPKFIWFRLHQYSGGQLGPGVVTKAWIQTEL